METYRFDFPITGQGETSKEAWKDAVDVLENMILKKYMPDDYEDYIIVSDDYYERG